jgi:hypothetical protein
MQMDGYASSAALAHLAAIFHPFHFVVSWPSNSITETLLIVFGPFSTRRVCVPSIEVFYFTLHDETPPNG